MSTLSCPRCPATNAKDKDIVPPSISQRQFAEVTSEMQELTIIYQYTEEQLYSDSVYLRGYYSKGVNNHMECASDNKYKVLLFKVDTGAEVTTMSESAWEELRKF